jgi:NADH dehydrogenase
VGSQSNDFGTPGVREHAISLDTRLEAKRFHSGLVNAYIRGHAQSTPLRPEQLNVVIIGAGATGAELAAELHYTMRQLIVYGLDRIDPEKDIKIELIEAADRILPALPERLSTAAAKLLQNLGVRVRTSSKVAEVLSTGVRLATGAFIPAELVVWAAGVRAPDYVQPRSARPPVVPPSDWGDPHRWLTRRPGRSASPRRGSRCRCRRDGPGPAPRRFSAAYAPPPPPCP